MRYTALFAIIAGTVSLTSNGFVYEMRVMHAPQARHTVVLCSDFHDRTHSATGPQNSLLADALVRADKNLLKVVTEDVSSCDTTGKRACGRFYLGPKGGILSGLADRCRKAGIETDNIEYRFCRVIALGPLMNSLRSATHSASGNSVSSRETSVADLHKEVRGILDEVRSYDDGSLLNRYYAATVRSIDRNLGSAFARKHANKSALQYVDASTRNRAHRINTLKKLFTFDSELLDARLLHSVVNTDPEKTTLVVAGGTHVDRVSDILKKIGYEVVHHQKGAHHHEYDLHKCVGSHVINDSFCVRPGAISLDTLKNYL